MVGPVYVSVGRYAVSLGRYIVSARCISGSVGWHAAPVGRHAVSVGRYAVSVGRYAASVRCVGGSLRCVGGPVRCVGRSVRCVGRSVRCVGGPVRCVGRSVRCVRAPMNALIRCRSGRVTLRGFCLPGTGVCRGPGQAAADVRTADADASESAGVTRRYHNQLPAPAEQRPTSPEPRFWHQRHFSEIPAVDTGQVCPCGWSLFFGVVLFGISFSGTLQRG